MGGTGSDFIYKMKASLCGNDDYPSYEMLSCFRRSREETQSLGFFFLLWAEDFYERFSGFYDHLSDSMSGFRGSMITYLIL
ncbi:hypothetical protein DP120_03060 [Planococcus halotolerans]|uniref:Uncharacterized protein n=1 Tax=Planococcus halotolerans TaxID=2233542 RepID=A0A365L835_9BACL|nr:hypothetical protein DP120_03060 [Planococcus halotolerans]